jgi:hypothetical protein
MHGFNSATYKSCAIPERTKKKYHFAVEKRKRGKAKVVPKSVGNEASGSAPSNLPPTTPLLDNRISVYTHITYTAAAAALNEYYPTKNNTTFLPSIATRYS